MTYAPKKVELAKTAENLRENLKKSFFRKTLSMSILRNKKLAL
jgi:hypothetical protein